MFLDWSQNYTFPSFFKLQLWSKNKLALKVVLNIIMSTFSDVVLLHLLQKEQVNLQINQKKTFTLT